MATPWQAEGKRGEQRPALFRNGGLLSSTSAGSLERPSILGARYSPQPNIWWVHRGVWGTLRGSIGGEFPKGLLFQQTGN